MIDNPEEARYQRAQKKVKDLKDFFSHVRAYVIINLLIIFLRSGFVDVIRGRIDDQDFLDWLDWNVLLTPALWGIGLLAHGLYVYRDRFTFFRSWEERKIKEFMEKDEQEFRNNRWE
ncbi:2TM domain-containing protein [Sungkyunkwania multivorans]|uniref:2TM domain-containing protein n=1 Tax=Sungkyunkwania multivorans TaxID=1173618 RepID=A0ABW3CSY1_9FLAO